MSAGLLAQGLLNSLSLTMVFILVALGLTLIFSILEVINFAHGEFYMLGGYVSFYALVAFKLDFFSTLLLAVVIVGVAGIIAERLIFRHLRGQMLNAFIVSLGLLWVMQAGTRLGFGVQEKSVPTVFPGIVRLGDLVISVERLVVIVCAAALIAILYLFLEFTRTGRAVRAVAQDSDAAALQGVNTELISALVFGVGCALAGAAGGLLAPIFSIGPTMGEAPVLKAFAIIIIGGMGSLLGAVAGGMLLGVIEGLGTLFMGSAAVSLFGFVIVILVLLMRPR